MVRVVGNQEVPLIHLLIFKYINKNSIPIFNTKFAFGRLIKSYEQIELDKIKSEKLKKIMMVTIDFLPWHNRRQFQKNKTKTAILAPKSWKH